MLRSVNQGQSTELSDLIHESNQAYAPAREKVSIDSCNFSPIQRSHRNQQVEQGQKYSKQATSLAHSVYAYAANINNLEVLLPVIERVAEKHVSVNVEAAQYLVIGEYLLAAIVGVLGEDVATPEVQAAWKEAYEFLADVFIKKENEIKERGAQQSGGWKGFRSFTITNIHPESDIISTFTMKPNDGDGLMKDWKAGQYCGLRMKFGEEIHTRNYSCSSLPGEDEISISVKKELSDNLELYPNGLVSNKLHEMKVGDLVELTPPCGTFILPDQVAESHPLVFLGVGSGIVPILPLAEQAAKNFPNNQVVILQGARHESNLCFQSEFNNLAKSNDQVSYLEAVKRPKDENVSAQSLDFDSLWALLPHKGTYFFSGPMEWMDAFKAGLEKNEIPANQICFEFFVPRI